MPKVPNTGLSISFTEKVLPKPGFVNQHLMANIELPGLMDGEANYINREKTTRKPGDQEKTTG